MGRFRPIIRSGAQSNDWAKTNLMFYVYFLYLINGDIYKGFCADLKIRMNEHGLGKVESTRNYRPVKMIGYEAYALKTDAMRREKFLKTTEGRRLLKLQYRDIINQFNGEVA